MHFLKNFWIQLLAFEKLALDLMWRNEAGSKPGQLREIKFVSSVCSSGI